MEIKFNLKGILLVLASLVVGAVSTEILLFLADGGVPYFDPEPATYLYLQTTESRPP